MRPEKLFQIIEAALKERRPAAYREMKRDGSLTKAVWALVGSCHQMITDGQQAALNAMANGEITAADLPMKFLEIERSAMEQVIEEIDAITESQPES